MKLRIFLVLILTILTINSQAAEVVFNKLGLCFVRTPMEESFKVKIIDIARYFEEDTVWVDAQERGRIDLITDIERHNPNSETRYGFYQIPKKVFLQLMKSYLNPKSIWVNWLKKEESRRVWSRWVHGMLVQSYAQDGIAYVRAKSEKEADLIFIMDRQLPGDIYIKEIIKKKR